MYQLIIFDWDGTLMDSAQKIAHCIQASARTVGLSPPDDSQAKSIIGLGLEDAMKRLFPGASPVQVKQLIEAYRHQFVTANDTPQGLFTGVEAGLAALTETGALLAVATGKARSGMRRIFAELPLEQYFVATRCADETRSKPHPQMLYELLDYTAIEPSRSIMVGDTSFDMEMAANAGVPGLGAGYGVHSPEELQRSGALAVLPSFAAVCEWLLQQKLQQAHG